MSSSSAIAVLGAGSWGTALAIHLAHTSHAQVMLWSHHRAHVTAMQTARANIQYLPEVAFPENLQLTSELSAALASARDILIAVPSHAFRATLELIKPLLTANTRIVWATKGLDPLHHQLLHEVVLEILGELPSAILSGPTFAKEVARGLPTAITVATQSAAFAADLTQRFHSKKFRVYTSTDVIGVEVGGAMKNVLAIAVGIADGLGFGANARAALITRGLAEMVRLGVQLGANANTLMGLAGIGDLVLTCTDDQSRNRRFGLALGSGSSKQQAEQQIGQVVEGIGTAQEVFHLSSRCGIEVPICEQVYHVLYDGLAPAAAVHALLAREPRAEGI